MNRPILLQNISAFAAAAQNRASKDLHRVGKWIVDLRTMSTEKLNLMLAALTVVLAILAVVVAIQTLRYMHRHDSETDTRSGWTEIHKAMVNLRVQRGFVLTQRGAMGAYTSGAPNQFEERKRDYDLATAQLRGQLERLNDDPLLAEIARFLDNNSEKWQREEYAEAFDGLAQKVAMKSRPK